MIPNDITAKLNVPAGRPLARAAAHAAEERGETAEALAADGGSLGEDVVTLSKSAVGAAQSEPAAAGGVGRIAIADERAAGFEAQALRQAIAAHPARARGAVGALGGVGSQLAARLSE